MSKSILKKLAASMCALGSLGVSAKAAKQEVPSTSSSGVKAGKGVGVEFTKMGNWFDGTYRGATWAEKTLDECNEAFFEVFGKGSENDSKEVVEFRRVVNDYAYETFYRVEKRFLWSRGVHNVEGRDTFFKKAKKVLDDLVWFSGWVDELVSKSRVGSAVLFALPKMVKRNLKKIAIDFHSLRHYGCSGRMLELVSSVYSPRLEALDSWYLNLKKDRSPSNGGGNLKGLESVALWQRIYDILKSRVKWENSKEIDKVELGDEKDVGESVYMGDVKDNDEEEKDDNEDDVEENDEEEKDDNEDDVEENDEEEKDDNEDDVEEKDKKEKNDDIEENDKKEKKDDVEEKDKKEKKDDNEDDVEENDEEEKDDNEDNVEDNDEEEKDDNEDDVEENDKKEKNDDVEEKDKKEKNDDDVEEKDKEEKNDDDVEEKGEQDKDDNGKDKDNDKEEINEENDDSGANTGASVEAEDNKVKDKDGEENGDEDDAGEEVDVESENENEEGVEA